MVPGRRRVSATEDTLRECLLLLTVENAGMSSCELREPTG